MTGINFGFTLIEPIFAFKLILILLKYVFLHPAVFQCLNLYNTITLVATSALGLAVGLLLNQQLFVAGIRHVESNGFIWKLVVLVYSWGTLNGNMPRE